MGTKDKSLLTFMIGVTALFLAWIIWILVSSPGSALAAIPFVLLVLIVYIWVKQMFFGGFGA